MHCEPDIEELAILLLVFAIRFTLRLPGVNVYSFLCTAKLSHTRAARFGVLSSNWAQKLSCHRRRHGMLNQDRAKLVTSCNPAKRITASPQHLLCHFEPEPDPACAQACQWKDSCWSNPQGWLSKIHHEAVEGRRRPLLPSAHRTRMFPPQAGDESCRHKRPNVTRINWSADTLYTLRKYI